MAVDSVWIKTHKVLNNFFAELTCKKCNERLGNPQQYLNCGHYSCAECAEFETNCVICQIPGEASDVFADRNVNDLLINLNILAEEVGFEIKKKKDFKSPNEHTISVNNNRNIREIAEKNFKKISFDERSNISVCESTISKITSGSSKNIDKKNRKGETALHIASRNNNEEKVKALLNNGANPNTKDNAGWTPLQEATSYGYYNICELLLIAGAQPNMIGIDNKTALHEAVIINNYDIVSLLVNHNANKDLCDKEGKKPKDYCKSKKMVELFDILNDLSLKEMAFKEEVDMNKTSNSFLDGKIVLYGSKLNLTNRKLLNRLSTEKKIKVVNNLSPSVSHVIVNADSDANVELSNDLLLAVLYGNYFLNSECLPILLNEQDVCPSNLSIFELNPPQLDNGPLRARNIIENQEPKLFNNCHFYFAIKSNDSIKYDGVPFKKEDLTRLVAAGDGILLTREPRPEDIQGSLTPFHVSNDPQHSLHKCTHYIIYVPANDYSHPNRIIYNMNNLKSLPLMWFVESILRYKLLDPVHLGLIPE